MKVIHPVTTGVGVILLVLFGMISLFGLPVQLTPDITQPQVSVMTIWPGASPEEVEREIIDEQEEQLKSLEGLEKMFSSSADSVATLTLRFYVGVDIDAAVLRVSNRLDQYRAQLTPDITQPQVSVMTIWPGASPEEVEREIIDEQEEQLKSLEGLEKMFSSSADSVATLTLRFYVGVDIDAAVLRVSNRLDQVPYRRRRQAHHLGAGSSADRFRLFRA